MWSASRRNSGTSELAAAGTPPTRRASSARETRPLHARSRLLKRSASHSHACPNSLRTVAATASRRPRSPGKRATLSATAPPGVRCERTAVEELPRRHLERDVRLPVRVDRDHVVALAGASQVRARVGRDDVQPRNRVEARDTAVRHPSPWDRSRRRRSGRPGRARRAREPSTRRRCPARVRAARGGGRAEARRGTCPTRRRSARCSGTRPSSTTTPSLSSSTREPSSRSRTSTYWYCDSPS